MPKIPARKPPVRRKRRKLTGGQKVAVGGSALSAFLLTQFLGGLEWAQYRLPFVLPHVAPSVSLWACLFVMVAIGAGRWFLSRSEDPRGGA